MTAMAPEGRHRNAPKTNELVALNLSIFAQDGLDGDVSRVLSWSNGKGRVGRARCNLSDQRALIHFESVHGAVVHQEIDLTITHPHFGGVRRWFVCPECRRRCRVLYHLDRFICRCCAGAVYPSQYDWVRVPGEAKAKRVRDRFGVMGGHEALSVSKPKGMHWRKFREMERLLWDAEVAFEGFIQSRL